MSERTFNTLRIVLFALLVVWGLYTLIEYLGVGVHQSVLLSEAARASIQQTCAPGATFCAGLHALLPFIGRSIAYLSPFLWYFIVSVVIVGILLFVEFMRSGQWRMHLTLSPLRLLLWFLLSMWLIFTVISAGTIEGAPATRLYEPLPQVYVSAGEEALQVLKENFEDLEDRGCLTPIGSTDHGARVFDLKHRCMQLSFFSRVVPPLFFVVYVLFAFLSFGRMLLRLLRLPSMHLLAESLFSVAIGASATIVILWMLALLSVYTTWVGWGLIILLPAVSFRHAHYWLRTFLQKTWTYSEAWYAGTPLLLWILVSLLALNYINVIRPFPIGWDDLGKYINQPRLMVSYGHFIPQLASFLWEYITSLGFLLFGYESVFGATLSMMFNWMAGLLAVLSVYVFGRLYLGQNQGILAALLYYIMPVVGHFSFADMKIDNAVFFMGSVATLAVFLALFPIAEDENEDEDVVVPWTYRWMVLAGILGGFAFAMKPTAIMVLMALGTIMFGALIHWTAFAGALSLAWALHTYEGRFNVTDIGQRVFGNPDALSQTVVALVFVVIGIAFLGYSVRGRMQAFRRTFIASAIFIGMFLLCIAPWVMYNNIQYGNVIPKLVFTAPNHITPSLELAPVDPSRTVVNARILSEELKVDTSKCVGSAKTEELDRYWGNHQGIGHYLTLPWRSVMNLDSAGYYVTMYPALLLFPLLLLLPFYWMRPGRWLRWLFVGTLFVLVQWMFFANGIVWYGLGVFFGLVIGLEALIYRAPDVPSQILSSILIGLSVLIGFSNRMWQFDMQRNLFEYGLGKVSAEAIQERTIPHYDDIRQFIEQRAEAMPDRPYVYRVGTFMPYFIPRNLEVLPVADNQLDLFNCLYQERDSQLLLKRLKALGFNSIIFDTNTHTIEQDPNGSLHKKVQLFLDFVNTPGLGVQAPVNDPDAGIAYILLP